MNRERLFAAFFFVAFLFLLYQLYLFLAPFAGPLVLAAVLVLALSPLTEALVRRLRGARTIAALLMSLGVFAIVLIPTAFLLSLLLAEATSQYDRVQQLLQEGQTEPAGEPRILAGRCLAVAPRPLPDARVRRSLEHVAGGDQARLRLGRPGGVGRSRRTRCSAW